MVSVTVTLEIEPSRVEEFLKVMTMNAAASRQEPGCLRFEISRSFEKPNCFALSEAYRDRAAMDAHYGTPHYAVWKELGATGIVVGRSAVKGDVIDA